MTKLTPQERAGEIITLRTRIRSNNSISSDLNKAIVETLEQHGIQVDSDVAPDLTIALTDEITKMLANVDLPGGTNCQKN